MESEKFKLEHASSLDLDALSALLLLGGLPIDDLDEDLIQGFIVARSAVTSNALVGTCGIEVCRTFGLLRSLAVDPSFRSRSLGRTLVENRLAWSRKKQMRALYLLTIDADSYFVRFGFNCIDRKDLPEEIRSTSQFNSLCPATAIAMVLHL